MDQDIKYITENYIELKELSVITGVSVEKLNTLIEQNLIPNYSYKIQTESLITSPLNDQKLVSEIKKYFPKSIINLIKCNVASNNAKVFKQKVKTAFVKTFSINKDRKFAYGNILDQKGVIKAEKLESVFESEWKHYLNGIYGICTLNASGSEIAKKEIIVKKIIDFIEQNKHSELNEKKKNLLLELNAEYNEVSNLFAPYQRESSSRGKYLDKLLSENSLEKLIKKYD